MGIMRKSKFEESKNDPYGTLVEDVSSKTRIYKVYLKSMPYLLGMAMSPLGGVLSKVALTILSMVIKEKIKDISENAIAKIIDNDGTNDGKLIIEIQNGTETKRVSLLIEDIIQASVIANNDIDLLRRMIEGLVEYEGIIQKREDYYEGKAFRVEKIKRSELEESKEKTQEITLNQLDEINKTSKRFEWKNLGIVGIISYLSKIFSPTATPLYNTGIYFLIRNMAKNFNKSLSNHEVDSQDGQNNGRFQGTLIENVMPLAKLAGSDTKKYEFFKKIINEYESEKNKSIKEMQERLAVISMPSLSQMIEKIMLKSKWLMSFKKIREFIDRHIPKKLPERRRK